MLIFYGSPRPSRPTPLTTKSRGRWTNFPSSSSLSLAFRLNISAANGGGSSGGGSATTDDDVQMTLLPSDDYGTILVESDYVPRASPRPPDYDETISRQRILRYYR